MRLGADGSFSIPAADLNKALELTCPAASGSGRHDALLDLTPYTGPAIGVGERTSSVVSGGPNSGKTVDYFVDAQQLTAAFDYVSLGKCGLNDGFLYNFGLREHHRHLRLQRRAHERRFELQPTRSEIQVDTANVYAPTSYFINSAAKGLPTLTNTYTLDTATGNVVVHESDPLVKCAKAAYPPTTSSCSSFVSTGVTDNRTITQDHDGHISWISDAFTSTDSAGHAVTRRGTTPSGSGGRAATRRSSSTSSPARARSRRTSWATPSRCPHPHPERS